MMKRHSPGTAGSSPTSSSGGGVEAEFEGVAVTADTA